jgi:hypothetical protein
MSNVDIDMDVILAQRAEASGQTDPTLATFKFAGETWEFPHPLFASDEWKDGFAELQKAGAKGDANDVDLARYYMGEETYERFIAAGGHSGVVLFAVQQLMARVQQETTAGPTQSSTFSRKRRGR